MLFELAVVLNVFVYGSVDFAKRSSAFPAHMLVLPATTRQLVGWPMLFCAVFFAGMWILSAGLLLLPAGFHPPIIWPATTIAATAVWIQAISWSPFPTPFAACRRWLWQFFRCQHWAFVQASTRQTTPYLALITAGNLIWLLAAYGVGVNGLSRTRAGKESDLLASLWKSWDARISTRSFASPADGRPPFRSPFAAQMWHECRRNVPSLPIMLAFVGVPMLPLLCLPIFSRETNSGLMIGSTTISPSMLGLSLFILFPLMISLMSGASFGKLDCWGKAQMSSFFATRPIATTNFVTAKIVAAAIVAIICWAIVLSLFAIWAGLEASPLNQHESLIRTLLSQATPRSIAAVLLGVFALVFFTWRNLASGMWLVLCGRKWVANLIGFGSVGLMFVGGLAAWWIRRSSGNPTAGDRISPVVLRNWPGNQIRNHRRGCRCVGASRSGAVRNGTLKIICGWFAAALAVFGVVCCFFSPSWIGGVAVLVALPLDAIALAPLALHWNRHR